MIRTKLLSGALALSLGLSPLAAFAATEKMDAVSEEEVLNVLEDEDMMMDRGGGGLYYPGPYGAGIVVDASVTKEVTPDFVAVTGYCEVMGMETRNEVKAELTKIYNAIKAAVGSDGRVRRNGSVSMYPSYGPYGDTNEFSGSVNVFVRLVNVSAAERISTILEDNNCSPGWDVRLNNAQDFEMNILDDLVTRVNKRKAIFEKLLRKKLTNVIGASLSTWADGWSTYDPETNTVDATTTLSITFGTNSRTRLPAPEPMPLREPRG